MTMHTLYIALAIFGPIALIGIAALFYAADDEAFSAPVDEEGYFF